MVHAPPAGVWPGVSYGPVMCAGYSSQGQTQREFGVSQNLQHHRQREREREGMRGREKYKEKSEGHRKVIVKMWLLMSATYCCLVILLYFFSHELEFE